MKKTSKIAIDIGMIFLFLLQMVYHLVGDSIHRWMGMILFVLLVLHNILNRRWYLGLFHGKYTPIRLFHTVVDLLLLISFLCVAISAVLLSGTFLQLFHWNGTILGRKLHMIFTTWSFVLMSVHVGLHENQIGPA